MRLIEPSWSRFLVCQSHLCRDWLITCQSDGWMDKAAWQRVGLRMREKSTQMTEGVGAALQNHTGSVVGAGSSCSTNLSPNIDAYFR